VARVGGGTRVRVEIMGSPKCGIVGKSQPVLMIIHPIISTRTIIHRWGRRQLAHHAHGARVERPLLLALTAGHDMGSRPEGSSLLLRRRAPPRWVSRAFPSWKRVTLTEIYLCHACSDHEVEDGNARAGRRARGREAPCRRPAREPVRVARPPH
jgi:hypothetical protein